MLAADSSPLSLTSLLLPPAPLVADLDGADGEDDGHDEEEDAARQPGRHGARLEVLRQLVGQSLADGVRLGRVGQHAELVALARATHVFD